MINRVVCECENVSYFDVEDVLNSSNSLKDAETTFDELQAAATQCSLTGGNCREAILDAMSEIMSR